MVKIMLQFAIKLLSDEDDVEFVNWCGSIYSLFQNFCTNDKEISFKFGFVSELNG